jgi:hypothetical protein
MLGLPLGYLWLQLSVCAGIPKPNLYTWLIFSADNGGGPGVLYELLVAGIYYCFIAASLAEVGDF